MKKTLSLLLALAMVLALAVPAASAAETGTVRLQKKYTVADYKEESYGIPPVVVDLDGDGRLEVLHGAYSLTVADAATGAIKWQVNGGKDRSTPYRDYGNDAGMFCKFIVKDFNGDGKNEIALGYTNGTVSLLNNQGYFMPGFPITVAAGARVQSLAADDVDGDGKVEIIAGVSNWSEPASVVYVYGCDGKLKPGWPQLQNDPASGLTASIYSWPLCNDGIATGDMDGDGLPEIVVPTDNYFVAAYNGDGTPVMAGDKFEKVPFSYNGQVPWFAVGFFEDYSQELTRPNSGLGWAPPYVTIQELGRKGTYGPGMSYATARFADVDGDGTQEVLITATMFDRTVSLLDPTNINCYNITHAQYSTVYVLNGDRTRLNKNGCNWETIPTNLTNRLLGKALNQNPIGGDGGTRLLDGGVHSVPVVGDINGDGVNEILFNSFDGMVHCYSARNSAKEVDGWPFILPMNTLRSPFEYAAEPTLADLDGDGTLEVIIVSWTETTSSKHPAIPSTGFNGSIYILDGSGKLLCQEKLAPMITYDNVSRSKPVVADIDGDGQMEILVSSSDYGGLIAYDVTVTGTLNPAKPVLPPIRTAEPNAQTITINGSEPITLDAYILYDAKGGGTNYVSVRDLAWYFTDVLGEENGVFDVTWDNDARVVNLITNQAYAGQKAAQSFTGPQPYSDAPVSIKVNGTAVDLKCITLTDAKGGGTTYYKLRDLGDALGFSVGWDGIDKPVPLTTK